MGCNKCKEEKDPCNKEVKCTCVVKDLSTDCTIYTGEELTCLEVKKGTKLTRILQKIDKLVCNIAAATPASLTNIGNGSELYKQVNNMGEAEIRTISSKNSNLLKVTQESNTIEIEAGTPKIEIVEKKKLQLSILTRGVKTVLSKIDLTSFLDSLKGDEGEKGEDGETAYDIWLELGNIGTKADFINSLKGEKGDTGVKGATGADGKKGDKGDKGDAGSAGTKGDTGPRGLKGDPGTNGTNGTNGKDGTNGTNGTNGADGAKGDTGAAGVCP